MQEQERRAHLALGAHIRREHSFRGNVIPTLEDIEMLYHEADRLNGVGTMYDLIDAQQDLIDALLVAYESAHPADVSSA